ncbi:M56 family metallopeptidase [Gimesia algae]|uniref:Regulatory protein BlaR1 n=1 Tax=Gimesia algae TaxID=2527971 RepID=A0A517VLW8_9PLAN|nr:M56 family metallopeptidase [Gimesia algae]QDT93965.1 Regulatory protein BlaR1 [Gimesia algae]
MQPTDVSIFSLVWQQFWQCSVLVLMVYLICRLVRFRRSHLTCLLWLIVLLKFITPPVWNSTTGLFCWIQTGLPAEVSPDLPPAKPELLTRTESIRLLTGDDMRKLPDVTVNPDFKVTIHENETSRQTPVHLDTAAIPVKSTAENIMRPPVRDSWQEIGVRVWVTVGVLIATVMLVRYLRCWHIIRRAGEQSHPELNRLLERLCAELKLKRRVRLLITHSRMGPAVIGLLRPTIILPTAILEGRSLAELEPVLAHELIHIRRGDLWIGLLQLLASVVWWFHPLVWFTGRRLKFEIEQCCDEEVLAELNCDPRQYAACLLEILELKQTLTAVPVVPGVRPVEITSKRLERIMRLGQGCQKRTPWWCWMIFVTLAAVVLPGAAFVVSAADQAEESTEAEEVQSEITPTVDSKKQTQTPGVSDVDKRKTDSSEVPYLSSEIDIPDLVAQISKRRTHTIKDLMDRARNVVGVMRAKDFLIEQIKMQIAELPEQEPDRKRNELVGLHPFYFETLQIPLRDERKQYYIRKINTWFIIDQDQLNINSADPEYHRRVEQALVKLRESEFTNLKITPTLVSVSQRVLQDYLLKRKSMKVFTRKQTVKKMYLDLRNVIWNEPEQVSYDDLVCDVLDLERSRDLMLRFLSTPHAKVVFVPSVILEPKQSATIASKIRLLKGMDANSLWWNTGEGGYGVSIDLQSGISDQTGDVRRDMLNYKLTFYQIDGETRIKAGDNGEERQVPLISQQHYKDAMLLKAGETLLAGGFRVESKADEEPEVLLVMLQAEQESVEQESLAERLRMGEGVNSEAGVSGKIQLDESQFKDSLVTISYLVGDLVLPIRRHVIVDSQKQQVKADQPRFEPLIELIQLKVTPEVWGDLRKTGCSIRPYSKTLSLIIRAKRSTHDQIADLLTRIRNFQDQMVPVEFNLFSTDDIQKWYQYWNTSGSAELKRLSDKIQTEDLNQGMLLNAPESEMIRHLVKQPGLIDLNQFGIKLALFNRQSAEFDFSSRIHEKIQSDCRIQFRPVIKSKDQIQISMVINADQAEDPLANLKSMTIPKGNAMLVDVTDQLTGQETPLMPYELISQGKKRTRFFLLVSPSEKITMTEPFRNQFTPPSR